MIDLLLTILAFVVAFSLLVAVHEFGHFWIARRVGVRVLRFSIGMGRPLLVWRRPDPNAVGEGDTEFVLAAWPVGGYVKMLDEREGSVAERDLPSAFTRQSLRGRAAIVVAGPLANFVFAIIAYWMMFVIGVPGLKPYLGEVTVDTPAAEAGLREGQLVRSVNGVAVPTWSALIDEILPPLLRGEVVRLEVEESGSRQEYRIDFRPLDTDVAPEVLVEQIGLTPFQPAIAPVLDTIEAGSAAENAGLRTGDRVTAIDGSPIEDWRTLVEAVRAHPDQPMTLSIERAQGRIDIEVTPQGRDDQGNRVGFLGAGVQFDPEEFGRYRGELRLGPIAAVGRAVERTWDMSLLTLEVMGKMLIGRMSVENISGPVSIARFAKGSADAGVSHFLAFLAVVSLSLGVINLLPIPVLDGGHLLFYTIEGVTGAPLRPETEMMAQRVGIALILSLMVLALYLDLMRILN